MTYTINGDNCFLGADDSQVDLEYSVYPNPASDLLNINVSNVGSNDMIVVYNILGEEVKNETLSNGLNVLSVSDLNNGVYFYSIVRNNEIVETKKLVVRK